MTTLSRPDEGTLVSTRVSSRRLLAATLAMVMAISILILQPPTGADAASTTRYAGADRYATSVEVSKWSPWSSSTVFLASGRDFADALAAGPVVAAERGRLLLTEPNAVPDSVMAELARLQPTSVVLIGSTSSISDAVLYQVYGALGVQVERIGGADRVATSLLLLDRLARSGPVSEVWVVSGASYPDALVAASVAGRNRAGIVLDYHGSSAAEAGAWRDRVVPAVSGRTVNIAGSDASVSEYDAQLLRYSGANVFRYAGANRYATAQVINDTFTQSTTDATMLLAPGDSFPDALAGSVLSAVRGWPLYLSPSECNVEVSALLRGERDQRGVQTIVGLGGRLTSDALGLVDCRPTPPPPSPLHFSALQNAMGQRHGMFVPMSFSGSGDTVLSLNGNYQVGLVTASYTGNGGNFAITALNSGYEYNDLLVNEIGRYDGTTLFGTYEWQDPTQYLEIVADGPWTIQVRDIRFAGEFNGNAAFGNGDNVVLTNGGAGTLTMNSSGSGYFGVHFRYADVYGSQTDLLANRVGPYSGATTIAGGPGFLQVQADGNWGLFR